MQAVEDHAPSSQLALLIRRNGQEQNLRVQLGSMEDAPLGFLREALLPLFDEPNMQRNNSGNNSDRWMSMLEDAVDEMQGEMRELREEIEELRIEKEGQQQKTSNLDDQPNTRFVAQRSRDRADRYGNNQGYRRGNRGRGIYGNNWNRYYNQRYLFPPVYSSPFYGNSYYNYGGRPYYYGGYGRNYGYGLRSGIQLGRGFGYYWY